MVVGTGVVRAVPCGDVLREEERILHRAERPQTGLKTVKSFHDTVYCIPVNDINRKLENVWKTFRDRPGSASGVRRHYRANYSVVKSGLVKIADLLTPSEPDAGSSAPDGNI